jgi:hypothetical protein
MHIIRGILSLVGAAVIVLATAFWLYLARHQMTAATHSEVGERDGRPAVLVATQGSEYKNAVTQTLLGHLGSRAPYVRVMDVATLPSVIEREWDAIVLIHTWEKWKPEPNARAFIERAHDRRKIVVPTTSGAGDERIPCVDAVTSASELDRAHRDGIELERRVDDVLANQGALVR